MKMKVDAKTGIRVTAILLSSMLFLSCSSDDEDSSPGGVSIPSAAIAITSENIDSVINQSAGARDNVAVASAAPGTGQSSTSPQPASNSESRQSLLLLNQLNAHSGSQLSPLATLSCPGGGTYTTPDGVDGIGDYVYENCTYSSLTYNGIISISGTGSIYGNTFSGSYYYDSLTVAIGNVVFSYDGSMNVAWDKSDTLTSLDYEVPDFSVVWGDHGVRVEGYVLSYTNNVANGFESWDYSYTVSSTHLNGSVHVETTQTILKDTDADFPYAGQLVWSGAGGSKARMTVEEGTGQATDYVTIEVDENGDGEYEFSKTVQWQDIA